MRLSLLFVLAAAAVLTEPANAQTDFRTAWGRHLGWGVGPGYHAYSQEQIHACLAHGQYGSACTTCAPFGVEAAAASQTSPMQRLPVPVTQPLPPGGNAGTPMLAPPQQHRAPAISPVRTLPVPSRPTANHRPVYRAPQAVHQIQAAGFQPRPVRMLPMPTRFAPQASHPLITPTGAAAAYSPRGSMPVPAGAAPPMTYRPY